MAVLVFLAASLSCGADMEKRTYYVQLVHGSDGKAPPPAHSQPIGPKLSGQVRRVMRYKSYWEVARKEVDVAEGHKASVMVGQHCKVEIDLTQPNKRRVTAFRKGKPVAADTRPSGQTMTIIGGDRDGNEAWFVVVRRDKPSNE